MAIRKEKSMSGHKTYLDFSIAKFAVFLLPALLTLAGVGVVTGQAPSVFFADRSVMPAWLVSLVRFANFYENSLVYFVYIAMLI